MQNTLRNALPIVAAALGRKFGVEVGVGGNDACTDGRRIQIPDVPDDPSSRDLAWGYLAHEAAHVRYTDFAAYEQAAREGPLQAMLQNRIEDVRIERELARPYPGTRATIAAVLRRLLAEGRMSAPEPGDHPAQVLAGDLLLVLRHEVLGQDVLAAETRKAAAALHQVFPVPFVARLRTLMDEVPGLTSTAEAVDLSRRIRRLIEDEADQPSANGSGETGDPDNEEQTDQSSGDASGQDDTESSQEETASQQGTNGEGSGDEAAPDAPESASDEDEDVRPDGSDTKPDNRSGTEPPDAVDANTKTMGDSGEDSDATDPQDSLAAVLASGSGDCDGDLFTEVGQLLGTGASATNAVRLPLPEDFAGNALAGSGPGGIGAAERPTARPGAGEPHGSPAVGEEWSAAGPEAAPPRGRGR